MTKKKSNLILAGVAIVVIILGVAGYLNQKNRDENVTPKIIEQLVDPYTQALKEGKYEYAYNNFTSDAYKNDNSLDEYIEAQKNNREKFGKLIDIEPLSGLFLQEKKMHKDWNFIGTLRYKAEQRQLRIQIEVIVSDEKKFLINNTYLSMLQYDSHSNQPMIF